MEEEGMATTIDPLFAEHYRSWIGFTRLIKFSLASVIIVLVLMAIFLL
jgi:Ni,Fe-hydrogenase I cytochrome b subunit